MACAKFKTQFDPPEVLPVASGRGMTNVYQFIINEETGRKELRKTGETFCDLDLGNKSSVHKTTN